MASWTTMLDMMYPIGTVYISVGDTSPANLFGGTWVSISAGNLAVNMWKRTA